MTVPNDSTPKTPAEPIGSIGSSPEPEGATTLNPDEEPKVFDQEYVKSLRSEAAKWRTKVRELEANQERAQQEEARRKLEDRGQYDEALKATLNKLAELEVKANTADRYESLIEKLIETQREALPGYLIELLNKMPKADQIEWLIEHGQQLASNQKKPQTKAGQESFNPPGAKQPLTDRERIAQMNRARGISGSLF